MNTVLIIAGKTGSGKSVLTKKICKEFNLKSVCLSPLGLELSTTRNPKAIEEIENRMFDLIYNTAFREEITVVDGLSSINVVNELKKHFHVFVCFLSVKRDKRIHNLLQREHLELGIVKKIEKEKEKNKRKSGLNKMRRIADLSIYDNSINSIFKIMSAIRNNEE